MNSPITKRELVTHELKWYWKSPQLRKEIRDISEAGMIDHAPTTATLPDLDEEQLDSLMNRDADPIIVRAMAEYSSSDIYALYRYVFLQDETHRVQVEVSPMTDKLDRFVLPYVGVMTAYAIADRLIAAYVAGALELSMDADLWLRQFRYLAARRLHIFTKKLTRLNADDTPTYGVSITGARVAQFWLRKPTVSDAEATLARQTYPGDHIDSRLVQATVTPTSITFQDYGRADRLRNRPVVSNVI